MAQKEIIDLIIKWYSEQKSLREIGREVGKNHKWVKRRLKENSVQILPHNKKLVGDTHICPVCSNEFFKKVRKKVQAVYCSPECAYKGRTLGITKRIIKTPYKVYRHTQEEKKYSNLWWQYRTRDKKKFGALPDFTLAEMTKRLENNHCHYCKISKVKLGLDRIDNSKGHTLKNTLVACGDCNRTRGDRFNVTQMEKLGKLIQEMNESI